MRYRLLGKSGLRVSELCLGTMTFGEDWGWGAPEAESRRIYDAFLEAGGNFIDTANMYTNGTSETLLGKFMAGQRERIVLATKYTNSMPTGDPNSAGNHRKNMMQAVEASLRRLGTDYIDVYWLHIWDFLTPVEEIMRGFDDLVRQGKVLYAGISDAPAWVIARANTIAELRGWTPFVGLQIEYSLTQRTPERELLPMAESLGLTTTAWSPLAGGILTGKYVARQTGSEPDRGRQSDPEAGRYDNPDMRQFIASPDRSAAIAAVVQDVARLNGHSPAQVALAWLRQRSVPVIPIIGARRLAQFQDNLACLGVRLDASALARLDDVSRIELGFPHDFYLRERVRTLVYAGMRDSIDV